MEQAWQRDLHSFEHVVDGLKRMVHGSAAVQLHARYSSINVHYLHHYELSWRHCVPSSR